jgi:energy-coupling factor transporter ATP-binding protein EcfA2
MEEKPEIQVRWLIGEEADFDFGRPDVFLVLGKRGAGKSSFLETIATQYLEAGGKVFDLFGAKDGEGLGWLRSPYVKKGGKRAVLFRGDLVKVKCEHEVIPASKFTLEDLDKGDIFISSAPLYESPDSEFDGVNRLLDVLWGRRRWTQPIFVLIREAANLVYSRLKLRENQQQAKAELCYLMREARHAGLALGIDTLRFTAIDIDIRSLADWLVLKNLGLFNLPDDLSWVYKYINPPSFRGLRPRHFVILSSGGGLGLGVFSMPPWHKREHEDILWETGVQVEYPGRLPDAVQLVAEALRNLPPEVPPSQVAEWIRQHQGTELSVDAVENYAKKLGYQLKISLSFREGKVVTTKLLARSGEITTPSGGTPSGEAGG